MTALKHILIIHPETSKNNMTKGKDIIVVGIQAWDIEIRYAKNIAENESKIEFCTNSPLDRISKNLKNGILKKLKKRFSVLNLVKNLIW
jgi:hypothetical protein